MHYAQNLNSSSLGRSEKRNWIIKGVALASKGEFVPGIHLTMQVRLWSEPSLHCTSNKGLCQQIALLFFYSYFSLLPS